MKIYQLKLPTDINGRPIPLFKSARGNNALAKAIDQLSGLCAGILADGVVNEQEAIFFAEWIRAHSPMKPVWPFTDILTRLQRIFADGKCDKEEREELGQVMAALCGIREESKPGETYSTRLPLDNPPPAPVIFPGREFHITGRFAYGARTKVVEAIETKGGMASDAMPTSGSHYLVIGVFATREWANTNFGRKIERAIELRNRGSGLAIIGEEHWKTFLV